MEVFGSLQQRVLWKWDSDSMDDLPPNVRLSKWLPQQDILGQLFRSHHTLLLIVSLTFTVMRERYVLRVHNSEARL